MNFKTTLILLVLLAGLAGGYLWLRSAPAPSITGTPTPEALVTGRRFERISIDHAGPAIELVFADGRWSQTQPVAFPVRGEAVEQLINAALALTPRETVAPAEVAPDGTSATPPDTGLDPPQAVVTLVSDTGTHVVKLGRTSVAGTAYLQTGDDPAVYLTDAALHQLVTNLEPASLRPQKLPGPDPARVNAVTLKRNNRAVQLTRTDAGWSLNPGGGERADESAVRGLTQVMAALTPLRYAGQDPAQLGSYGLAQPSAVFSVKDAAGQSYTLRVGQTADLQGQTVYATWSATDEPSPVVFTLPAALVAPLEVEADALRDPRLVTALPESIRGQHVNRVGRDSVELALTSRADTGFRFVEPTPGYAPDPELAPRWLTILPRVTNRGYTRAPREAQAPLAVVELKLAGDRSEFVRLYADRDGREDVLLAVRENETVAAIVPREQLAPLLAPVVTLRDRSLPTTTPHETVRLVRDDGHEFIFLPPAPGNNNSAPGSSPGSAPGSDNSDSGGWRLEGVDDEWESASFARLNDWLETPRVATWTALHELPRGPIARLSTGPDKPAYVVNVDQNLGQRTDLPGVFRLPEDLVPLLAGEYRPRLVLPLRPDQIREVLVGRGYPDRPGDNEGVATVRRETDGRFVDELGRALDDQTAAAELFLGLAGLTAKRFVAEPAQPAADEPVAFLQIESADGRTFFLGRQRSGVWGTENQAFLIDAETDARLTRKDTPWASAWLYAPASPTTP